MGKRIHHMGMTHTREEHDRFHREARGLTPEQHDAFTKKLGISREQDEEWHRIHMTPGEQQAKGAGTLQGISPFAVGGGFLSWCMKQGSLVKKGRQYFATKDGARELRERFDINAGQRSSQSAICRPVSGHEYPASGEPHSAQLRRHGP